jgi:peptidoglycan glycosyltransferase/penicillin-binding protein 2
MAKMPLSDGGFFMFKTVHKRLKILMILFVAAVFLLALRVFYLQVPMSDSLTKAAYSQRMASSSIGVVRGNITDINGIPFTNREVGYTAVLKPIYLDGDLKAIGEIAGIIGLDAGRLAADMAKQAQPVLFEVDGTQKEALLALDTDGVSIVNSYKRYGETSLARHIVGYLGKKDQKGQSGLEKYFENVLAGSEASYVAAINDATNKPVKGKGYRLINREDVNGTSNVRLTVDYHIQAIVERVMKEGNLTGAVVVEDINNGDIKAMASFPDFDQTRVGDYLNSNRNELYNRATAAYNLGSIFKIIDAAAFLEDDEYNALAEVYECVGWIKAGGNTFKCLSNDVGGHGYLNMKDAFAYSCNTWFINMAIQTGYHKVINMAENFGLGSATGIENQGIPEEKGNLPSKDSYYSSGDIANLSIGQGVMMATPLQVADIAATIANGGIKNKINIVDSIVDSEGKVVKKIRADEGSRIISKETADNIKMMMESVTDFGTGKAAAMPEYGGSAGKTGSAETSNGDIVHAWFAGYFPQKQPKYAIAVLIENGQYGGKAAAPVFAEIASEIMKKGY